MQMIVSGRTVLVDDDDFEWLSKFRWRLSKHPNNAGYIRVSSGERCGESMHRMILERQCPIKGVVDHRNHDTLDNRKCNLRLATHAENMRNSRRHRDNSTGFKGVWPHRFGRYVAEITNNGIRHYLGMFDTPEEAHQAYVKAAERFHGEFACAA